MRSFFKLAFYLFHPLWIPTIAGLFYFLHSPHPYPRPIIEAKLLAVIVLTIFIPLMILFLSKNTPLLTSTHSKSMKEFRAYLLFSAGAILLINNFILNSLFLELTSFYTAALFSTGILYFLSFIHLKISLHIVALSAFLGFAAGMSASCNTNLLWLLAALVFALGWTGSSRLYFKLNSKREIVWAAIIGLIPQVLFFLSVHLYKI